LMKLLILTPLVVAAALPGSKEDCSQLSRQVLRARAGDSKAQEVLLKYVREARSSKCNDRFIPHEFSTELDEWAKDDLRAAAQKAQPVEFARAALVAWWRLTSGSDPAFVRGIMDDSKRDPVIRSTATYILANAGDKQALDQRAKLRAQVCQSSDSQRRIGIGASEDAAIALLVDPNFMTEFRVNFVCPGSPAAGAGFQEGDRILAIDDVVCHSWIECFNGLTKAWSDAGESVSVVVETGARRLAVRRLSKK
jgi:hypothetical protein